MFKQTGLGNRHLTFSQILVCAACMGIIIGWLSTAYYVVLQEGLQIVWTALPTKLNWEPNNLHHYAWILTTIGGFLVGLSVHYLGAATGLTSAVEEIHSEGRIDYRQTPGTIVASL